MATRVGTSLERICLCHARKTCAECMSGQSSMLFSAVSFQDNVTIVIHSCQGVFNSADYCANIPRLSNNPLMFSVRLASSCPAPHSNSGYASIVDLLLPFSSVRLGPMRKYDGNTTVLAVPTFCTTPEVISPISCSCDHLHELWPIRQFLGRCFNGLSSVAPHLPASSCKV